MQTCVSFKWEWICSRSFSPLWLWMGGRTEFNRSYYGEPGCRERRKASTQLAFNLFPFRPFWAPGLWDNVTHTKSASFLLINPLWKHSQKYPELYPSLGCAYEHIEIVSSRKKVSKMLDQRALDAPLPAYLQPQLQNTWSITYLLKQRLKFPTSFTAWVGCDWGLNNGMSRLSVYSLRTGSRSLSEGREATRTAIPCLASLSVLSKSVAWVLFAFSLHIYLRESIIFSVL